ncbi:Leukotriene A-4 hydrolase, partial [Pseudolycoriella hygida]
SKLWAEQEVVDEAAEEFSNTPKLLQKAVDICGPYVWKQFDLLVMPPSFPFGGMENPCLTFVTPTILAGDKSLTNIVAHEIAHSWAGNLVTNANFEHFWINEGFASFVEAKVATNDSASRDFHAIRKLQELKNCLSGQLANKTVLSKLVLNLSGLSPEDSYSTVPYVKGEIFLRYLEDLLGGPKSFEPFLRYFFDKFKFQSIRTPQVKAAVIEYFKKDYAKELAQVDWNTWLYGEGMPPVIPKYDQTMAEASNRHAKIWAKSKVDDIDTTRLSGQLTSTQVIDLLLKLNAEANITDLSDKFISKFEKTYRINKTKNSEIHFGFARLCIRAKLLDRLDEIFDFLNSNHRAKFARPIYRDLSEWPDALGDTISNYNKEKSGMMATTSVQIARELGLL